MQHRPPAQAEARHYCIVAPELLDSLVQQQLPRVGVDLVSSLGDSSPQRGQG
jgi:hypothetical protein